MRIDGIHIKNFLSFDTFEWSNLDLHLNIIVGPNGSGKTNLIHALRVVKDVLNPNPESQRSLWSQSAYRGSSDVPIEISLDIQFTEAWEKKLLSTFLAASLCNDSVIRDTINKLVNDGNQVSSDREAQQAQLSELLQEHLQPKDIEWLFTGRLVVVYRGVNTWTSWYESRSDKQPFRLNLDTFSFYDDSAISRCLQTLLSKRNKFASDNQLLLSGMSSMTSKPYPRVEYSSNLLATHRAFEKLTGVTFENGRPYGASYVFNLLLERALVFSDNIRSQPLYTFSYDHFHTQPIDLSSGEQLARYLFLKKNGSQADQDEYEATHKLFSKITGRTFDVSFDQSAISAQSSEEKSNIILSIHVNSDWGDIPLAFSGAGRAEALFLCALIASRNEQVILLDEPALNIHVTMQKAILNEFQAQRDNQNQFILVTHSPTLIPPAAIANISRFALYHGSTHRFAINIGTHELNTSDANIQDINIWDTRSLTNIAQELRQSSDACAMLFSQYVILVEGPTEQGALPIWFEKQYNNILENKDIVVYSVGSDTNFEKFVKLLRQLGIFWAIICDGKVIGDYIANRTKSRILQQLDGAGISIPNSPNYNDKDFSQLCQEFETYGVFTHAKNADDEIESLSIIQSHKQEAKNQVGRSKVRQGQYIATSYDCPDEIAHLLKKAIDYLEKQDYQQDTREAS